MGNELQPLVPLPAMPIKGTGSAPDAQRRANRRMKTAAYRTGQRVRKRVEEIIGWRKTVGGLRRTSAAMAVGDASTRNMKRTNRWITSSEGTC